MHRALIVPFAIAVLRCATVRVDVGPGLAAVGTPYTTSAGDARERFAHIPYATRARAFDMPVPVDYRSGVLPAHASAGDVSSSDAALGVPSQSGLLNSRIVNPTTAAAIAPQQGTMTLAPEYVRYAGVETPPEDDARCMQLDVFRPAGHAPRPRPVVVYLHGGMMESEHRGSVVYRPDDLMRALPTDSSADAIVVAVEYSLGAYGWWYEPAGAAPSARSPNTLERYYGVAPANLALHQAIQALLWVHRHIASFNGDPGDVTLAGHSAGAAIAQWVHLVLTTKTRTRYEISSPLFHKLLLMGGSALLFPAVAPLEAATQGKAVLNHTPCKDTVGMARLECLRSLNPAELKAAALAAHALWTPVIDGILVTDTTNALLERQNTPARDWDTNIRVLLTVTADETALFCVVFKAQLEADLRGTWTSMGIEAHHAEELIAAEHTETMRNPLVATSRRSRDICFGAPAIAVRDAYLAAGVPSVQVAHVDIVFDADVKALVTAKLDAVCNHFYGVNFATAARAMQLRGGAEALISGGLSTVRSISSTLLSAFSTSPATTDEQPSSGRSSWLSLGGYFGSSPQNTSQSPPPLIAAAAEEEYLYGIPKLTKERLNKLIDSKTLDAFARLVAEHISGFGTFHGLDQIVLLNATLNFSGIVVRADELFSPASGEAITTPVRSFIATGTAVAKGGLPLAPLDVRAYQTCCRVGTRGIITSIKRSPGSLPILDMDYLANVVDTIGHSHETYAALSVQIRGFQPREQTPRLERDTDEEGESKSPVQKGDTRKRKHGGRQDS